MQFELYVLFVRVLVQMVNSIRIEGGGPPLHAMNAVPLGKQQFRQISTVLSGNSGNQRRLGQIILHAGKHKALLGLVSRKSATAVSRPSRYIRTRSLELLRRIVGCR